MLSSWFKAGYEGFDDEKDYQQFLQERDDDPNDSGDEWSEDPYQQMLLCRMGMDNRHRSGAGAQIAIPEDDDDDEDADEGYDCGYYDDNEDDNADAIGIRNSRTHFFNSNSNFEEYRERLETNDLAGHNIFGADEPRVLTTATDRDQERRARRDFKRRQAAFYSDSQIGRKGKHPRNEDSNVTHTPKASRASALNAVEVPASLIFSSKSNQAAAPGQTLIGAPKAILTPIPSYIGHTTINVLIPTTNKGRSGQSYIVSFGGINLAQVLAPTATGAQPEATASGQHLLSEGRQLSAQLYRPQIHCPTSRFDCDDLPEGDLKKVLVNTPVETTTSKSGALPTGRFGHCLVPLTSGSTAGAVSMIIIGGCCDTSIGSLRRNVFSTTRSANIKVPTVQNPTISLNQSVVPKAVVLDPWLVSMKDITMKPSKRRSEAAKVATSKEDDVARVAELCRQSVRSSLVGSYLESSASSQVASQESVTSSTGSSSTCVSFVDPETGRVMRRSNPSSFCGLLRPPSSNSPIPSLPPPPQQQQAPSTTPNPCPVLSADYRMVHTIVGDAPTPRCFATCVALPPEWLQRPMNGIGGSNPSATSNVSFHSLLLFGGTYDGLHPVGWHGLRDKDSAAGNSFVQSIRGVDDGAHVLPDDVAVMSEQDTDASDGEGLGVDSEQAQAQAVSRRARREVRDRASAVDELVVIHFDLSERAMVCETQAVRTKESNLQEHRPRPLHRRGHAPLVSRAPVPRFGHSASILDSTRQMCVFGGIGGVRGVSNVRSKPAILSDCWTLDVATMRWQEVVLWHSSPNPIPFPLRAFHSAIVIGEKDKTSSSSRPDATAKTCATEHIVLLGGRLGEPSGEVDEWNKSALLAADMTALGGVVISVGSAAWRPLKLNLPLNEPTSSKTDAEVFVDLTRRQYSSAIPSTAQSQRRVAAIRANEAVSLRDMVQLLGDRRNLQAVELVKSAPAPDAALTAYAVNVKTKPAHKRQDRLSLGLSLELLKKHQRQTDGNDSDDNPELEVGALLASGRKQEGKLVDQTLPSSASTSMPAGQQRKRIRFEFDDSLASKPLATVDGDADTGYVRSSSPDDDTQMPTPPQHCALEVAVEASDTFDFEMPELNDTLEAEQPTPNIAVSKPPVLDWSSPIVSNTTESTGQGSKAMPTDEARVALSAKIEYRAISALHGSHLQACALYNKYTRFTSILVNGGDASFDLPLSTIIRMPPLGQIDTEGSSLRPYTTRRAPSMNRRLPSKDPVKGSSVLFPPLKNMLACLIASDDRWLRPTVVKAPIHVVGTPSREYWVPSDAGAKNVLDPTKQARYAAASRGLGYRPKLLANSLH